MLTIKRVTFLLAFLFLIVGSVFGQGIEQELIFTSRNGDIDAFSFGRSSDYLVYSTNNVVHIVSGFSGDSPVITSFDEYTYSFGGEELTADFSVGLDFAVEAERRSGGPNTTFIKTGVPGNGHLLIFQDTTFIGGAPVYVTDLVEMSTKVFTNVHVNPNQHLPGSIEPDLEIDPDFFFSNDNVAEFTAGDFITSVRERDVTDLPLWINAEGNELRFIYQGEQKSHLQSEENWPVPRFKLLTGDPLFRTGQPGTEPIIRYLGATDTPSLLVLINKNRDNISDPFGDPWDENNFTMLDAENDAKFISLASPRYFANPESSAQLTQWSLLDETGTVYMFQARDNTLCSLRDSISGGGVDVMKFRSVQDIYIVQGNRISLVNLNGFTCEGSPMSLFEGNPMSGGVGMVDTTICQGGSVMLFGETFDENRTTSEVILPGQAADGGDSTVMVTVDFYPLAQGSFSTEVCLGESVLIAGTTYEAGNYPESITLAGAASSGCDSIVSVSITVLPNDDTSCGGTNPGEADFDCRPESTPFCLSQEQTRLGGQACVDFRARNFEDIIAFQFSVEFDPGQIGYDEIVLSDQLPGLTTEDNFELQRANEGIITFSYNLLTGASLTLNDDTSLFQLCFTGLSGGLAPVTVTDTILGSTMVVYSDFSESEYAGNVGSVEVILCSDTTVTIDTLICQGETVTFDNTIIAAAGTYSQTVQTPGGCDSTTILNLAINEVEFAFPPTIGFCPGETRLVSGPDSVVIGLLSTPDDMLASNLILPLGESTVKIRELNSGCIQLQTISVFEFTPPTITVTGAREYCENEAGTLVTASGAQSYLWSTGDTSATAFLVTGTYLVTGTDGNGCETTEEIVIETLPLPTLSLQGSLTYCAGEAGATITVTGAQDYTFSNGTTSSTATLSAGEYFVVGTGVNGCSDTLEFVVEELPLPTAGIGGSTSYCADEEGVTLTASGGISYRWSNDVESAVNTVLAGAYSVTVTGENGCSSVASVTVEELSLPEIDIEGTASYCSGEPGATVTAVGGETYLWSTGAETATVTLAAGTYSVTATDNNGCEAMAEITIVENPLPVVQILGDPNVCPQDGGALLTATGGNFYQWSTGASTASIVAQVGTYGVTVTNDNGCSDSASITVVGDTISPVILACPPDRSGVLNFEETEVAINWNEPFAEDNCSTPTLTGPSGGTNGGLYREGTTTIIYEAVDDAGNSSSCSFNIEVRRSDDLTFYVDGDGGTIENGVVCIPIRVRDFTEVVTFGVAFSLPDIPGVEYVATVPGQEVSATAGGGFFAAQNNAQNEVAVTYLNAQGAGLTLPDDGLAFTIKATLPGTPGDCFDIGTVLDLIAVEALQLSIGATVPTLIPGEVCIPNRFEVTGRVYRPDPERSPVSATDVERESSDGSDDFDITDLAGRYAFEDLDGNAMHTFTPERDFEHNAGLSVLDMARMIFHIRGIEFITDPYLLIAANVNDDDRISLLDIAPVRRVILGTVGEFPDNKSWRFLPVDYTIDPLTPINEYEESVTLPGLDQDGEVDFYGVKIGDLNYSPLSLREEPGEVGSVSFSLRDRWLRAGEEVRVPVWYAVGQPRLIGYQQTWSYNPNSISLVGTSTGSKNDKDLAVTHDERDGIIRALYLDHDPKVGSGLKNSEPSEVLVMTFRVLQSGWLHDVLHWAPEDSMPSLAAVGERPREVESVFSFEGNDHQNTFAITVNPNPVEDEAIATLSLPGRGAWELNLLDVQGRIVGVARGVVSGAGTTRTAVPGLRTVQAGTYYLRLKSGDRSVVTSLIKH